MSNPIVIPLLLNTYHLIFIINPQKKTNKKKKSILHLQKSLLNEVRKRNKMEKVTVRLQIIITRWSRGKGRFI